MNVGICRIGLAIPGNRSLKGKRAVVRKLLDRVRARFHVSAAEVDEQDAHQRAVLGICTVGADGRKIEQVLTRVLEFVEASGLAQVISTEVDVVGYEDLAGELSMESYADKFGIDDEPILDDFEEEPGSGHDRKARIKPGSLGFGSSSDDEAE